MARKVTVKGREKLRVQCNADASGVTIRLDDDCRPDFWAEVRLDLGTLVALLAECDQAKAAERQARDSEVSDLTAEDP